MVDGMMPIWEKPKGTEGGRQPAHESALGAPGRRATALPARKCGGLDPRQEQLVNLKAQKVTPRRVCFVVNHSAAGGIGELWVDLAGGLAQRGHDSWLAAFWPLPEAARATTEAVSWTHICQCKPRTPGQLATFFFRLVRYFRQTRPEWVITAMPAANLLVPLAASIADRRIRVVSTHHTPANTLSGVVGVLDRYGRLLPNVAVAVSVSNAVAASYAQTDSWLATKQKVIHNALPPHVDGRLAELKAARDKRRGDGPRNHVVALGRLAHQKNYEVLIRAARQLQDVRISIVGGGPEEGRLRSLIDACGVADRVTLHGSMSREKALTMLALADVFVQMSRFEGHSLALIEAAKLGIPLVVSNIPVQVEGISDEQGCACGVLVEQDDDTGLASALKRLLADDRFYEQMTERSTRLGKGASFDSVIFEYQRLLA